MKKRITFLLAMASIIIFGHAILNETKIKPDTTNADEFFAKAIDMDDGRAIVGAPVSDPFKIEGGSVYIYEREGGWVQKAMIRKWDQDDYKAFGTDVGISGDYAIVGSPMSKLKYGISSGAAYIFVRSEGIWTQQARLDGETMNQGLDFGQAVDIHGDYAIVGAHDYDRDHGAAYIYHREDSDWKLQVKLKGGGVERGDKFGITVAIEGNYAAIGAPEGDEGRGNVYIFSRNGDTWTQRARLTAEAKSEIPPDPVIQNEITEAAADVADQDISSALDKEKINSERDYFGTSIDMDGGKLIVGAPGHDYENFGDYDEGAAYIFDVASGTPLAKLRNEDGMKGDIITPQYAFGTSVAISGNNSLVGAIGSGGDNGMTGGAYAFTGSQQTEFYLPTDVQGDVNFGHAVALSGNCPWVGAPGEGWDTQKYGAVYSYCGSAAEVDQEVILDLVIHKPKVLDEEQTAIEDGEEESKGAQTFVNLDNDDMDNFYDDHENDLVSGGDDELIPVSITLKPNTISDGKVSIKITKGEENIRLWDSNERRQLIDASTLLFVADDFEVKSEVLVDTIWVEGIKGHDIQQGTLLELTYEGESTPCPSECTDAVAITVLGIKGQTWKGRENGFTADGKHNSNDLDECPIHKKTATFNNLYKSNRLFPGGRYPTTGIQNRVVDLEIELTVAPVEDIDLYLRSFDIDDPAGGDNFIDPNDLAAVGGNYPGTQINYTAEEDNRGTPKAGLLMNEDDEGIAKLSFTPSSSKEEIAFWASMHPGDNYRVVANGDHDFLKHLVNKDSEDYHLISDDNVEAGDEKLRWENLYAVDGNLNAKYTSNALVVWRILHVESDAMLNPNYEMLEGLVTNLTSGFKKLRLSENLDDGSANKDSPTSGFPECGSPPPGNGRYHQGDIMLAETVTITVSSNGVDYVNIEQWPNLAEFPLPFSILTSEGSPFSGDIIGITQDGGWRFKINVPGIPTNQLPWSLLTGGSIRVGAGPAVSIYDIHKDSASVEVTSLQIPFMLADDDKTTEIPFCDISTLKESFKKAYILTELDGGGDLANNKKNVPFVRNSPLAMDPNLASSVEPYRESKSNESDLFWVVYLLGAHEYAPCHADGSIRGDGDPNRESMVYGISPPMGTTSMHGIGVGGDVTYIFFECERESYAAPGWPDVDHGLNVAHEVGHQFGLGHNQGDLMKGADQVTSDLAKESVNLVRSRVRSPGE